MAFTRRDLLRTGVALSAGATGVSLAPAAMAFPETDVRRLGLANLHTGESLSVAYWEHGAYLPDALAAVNRVLRDHRTGDVHAIDVSLLDLLVALSGRIGSPAGYEVISGYRSPMTNAALHERSNGVASHSLHMEGRAIDVRVDGLDLVRLRDAALGLSRGGVGYYPTSDFVHVDVGRVRRWSGD